MNILLAYTAALARFPATVSTFVAGAAAFLGAAIPGLQLARLHAGGLALDDGVRWGTIAGSAATFFVSLAALSILRGLAVQGPMRRRTAGWLAAQAILGPAAVVLGAAIGAWVASGEPLGGLIGGAVARGAVTWPMVVASLLLGGAAGVDPAKVEG